MPATYPPALVGLIGRKRHGKDTFADVLVQPAAFTKAGFADPLREARASAINPLVGLARLASAGSPRYAASPRPLRRGPRARSATRAPRTSTPSCASSYSASARTASGASTRTSGSAWRASASTPAPPTSCSPTSGSPTRPTPSATAAATSSASSARPSPPTRASTRARARSTATAPTSRSTYRDLDDFRVRGLPRSVATLGAMTPRTIPGRMTREPRILHRMRGFLASGTQSQSNLAVCATCARVAGMTTLAKLAEQCDKRHARVSQRGQQMPAGASFATGCRGR